MKEENKKCWSCGRFQSFYTKGYCNFKKEEVGFCSYKNKIVNKNESCKTWNYRLTVRNMRKRMAINSIVDIRNKLEVIEQILMEESELDKIKNEK